MLSKSMICLVALATAVIARPVAAQQPFDESRYPDFAGQWEGIGRLGVFDQTKPEEPAEFPVGGLIPGWVEVLKLMKTGDTWEIVIPSDLGYGSDGAGDAIPPDQTLVFTMALAKVEYAP